MEKMYIPAQPNLLAYRCCSKCSDSNYGRRFTDYARDPVKISVALPGSSPETGLAIQTDYDEWNVLQN